MSQFVGVFHSQHPNAKELYTPHNREGCSCEQHPPEVHWPQDPSVFPNGITKTSRLPPPEATTGSPPTFIAGGLSCDLTSG
jgi:hypothetical protein